MAFNLSNLNRYSKTRGIKVASRPLAVPKLPSRTRVFPTPTRSTFSLLARLPSGHTSIIRPGVTARARPQAIIPSRPRIDINGGVPFGVVAASGGTPSRGGTAATAGGGLPALSAGGFDLGLGAMGGQIGSSVTGIIDQMRNLIPLAIKIIIAVIIVKIVLWLVRGRRR